MTLPQQEPHLHGNDPLSIKNTPIRPQETLFHLVGEAKHLYTLINRALDESEGDVTDYVDGLLLDEEFVLTKIKDKAEAYGYVMAELGSDADQLRAKADSLQARANALYDFAKQKDTAIDRLKRRLRDGLKHLGLKRLDAGEFKVSIRKGSERTIVDESVDLEQIPEAFVRVRKSPDKTAIKAALKAGATFPWARLERGEDTLTIK